MSGEQRHQAAMIIEIGGKEVSAIGSLGHWRLVSHGAASGEDHTLPGRLPVLSKRLVPQCSSDSLLHSWITSSALGLSGCTETDIKGKA